MRKPTLILLALLASLIPASSFAQTGIPAGKYDKIIVVIGENLGHDNLFDSTCGDTVDATYINTTLAQLALSYTDAHSSIHPSLPNYLRLFAATNTDGNEIIDSDGCVCTSTGLSTCDGSVTCGMGQTAWVPLNGVATLYDRLRDDNNPDTSFILWAEGLLDGNTNRFICMTSSNYTQKHNPAAFFTSARTDECNMTVWTGFTHNAITLPAPDSYGSGRLFQTPKGVAFVIPSQDHNGHNGSLQTAVQSWNNWLRDHIGPYVDFALKRNAYQGTLENALLIITQDEKSSGYDQCGTPNHILLFLIAADIAGNTTDCATLNTAQYNILKTITQNFAVNGLNESVGSNYPALRPNIPCP